MTKPKKQRSKPTRRPRPPPRRTDSPSASSDPTNDTDDPSSDSETAAQELARFRAALRPARLGIRDMPRDGNCFFYALADQLKGRPTNPSADALAASLRAEVCDAMATRSAEFQHFVAAGEDADEEQGDAFAAYLERLRKDGAWAGNLEVQAASLHFKCNIWVHQLDAPDYIVRNFTDPRARLLRLSYHQQEHWASVRRLEDISSDRPAVHPTPEDSAVADAVRRLARKTNHTQEEARKILDDCDGDEEAALECLRAAAPGHVKGAPAHGTRQASRAKRKERPERGQDHDLQEGCGAGNLAALAI